MAGRGPMRSSRNLSTSSGYTSGSQYSYDSEYMTNTDLSESETDTGYTRTIIKSQEHVYPKTGLQRGQYYNYTKPQQKKSGCCKKFFKFLLFVVTVAVFAYLIALFLMMSGVIDQEHPVAQSIYQFETSVMGFTSSCLTGCRETFRTERTTKENFMAMYDNAKNGDFTGTKEVATDIANDAADTVNDAKEIYVPVIVDYYTTADEMAEGNRFTNCCMFLTCLSIPLFAIYGCFTAFVHVLYARNIPK